MRRTRQTALLLSSFVCRAGINRVSPNKNVSFAVDNLFFVPPHATSRYGADTFCHGGQLTSFFPHTDPATAFPARLHYATRLINRRTFTFVRAVVIFVTRNRFSTARPPFESRARFPPICFATTISFRRTTC